MDSGDKVSFFFEKNADAFNASTVNKIGHALHVQDNVFGNFTINQKIREIASDLNFVKPQILQSMIILKNVNIGSEVPPHTDSTFLYTKPVSAVGFWFAMQKW